MMYCIKAMLVEIQKKKKKKKEEEEEAREKKYLEGKIGMLCSLQIWQVKVRERHDLWVRWI